MFVADEIEDVCDLFGAAVNRMNSLRVEEAAPIEKMEKSTLRTVRPLAETALQRTPVQVLRAGVAVQAALAS